MGGGSVFNFRSNKKWVNFRLPLTAGLEDVGNLFPGEPARPPGKVDLVGRGHLLLTIGERKHLNLDAMHRAPHPTRGIPEVDLVLPERHIFKEPGTSGVVRNAQLATFRTLRSRIGTCYE